MTHLMKSVLQSFMLIALFYQTGFTQTREAGFEAMMMEKWDKAIEVYTALTKADNTDQDAWLTLGNAWLAKGDKTKAQEAFSNGFNAKPDGGLAFICNGRQLLLQGRQAEADEQFEKASKKGKKDMNVHRQIGESFFFFVASGDRKPNLARATDWHKKAIDVNGKDYNTLMSTGYVYREQGNGGEAARHFEFASQYNPKSPLPFYMLATVYKAGKLNAKFMENIESAIALDNSYTPALRAKADFLYNSRKWESARDAYKDLVEKGKEVIIEDEMQLANSLFLTKDYKGCITLVEKIIAKDGSKNYLRRLLGYCYYENGDYQKGEAIMQEYFKNVPKEKIIASDYIYQGRLAIKSQKDTAAAITSYQKAIETDTAEWPLREDIANLYYAQRNWCSAAQNYALWIDSLGSTASALNFYRLGYCHYYCKDDSMRFQKALKSFQKVTELNPAAGIGWLWSGKTSAKMDVDIQADTSAAAIAKFGLAKPYYDKYVEVASVDKVKNKSGLIEAFEYIVYYHFVRKEDAQTREYVTKILEIAPDNKTALELQNILNSATAPPANGGKG